MCQLATCSSLHFIPHSSQKTAGTSKDKQKHCRSGSSFHPESGPEVPGWLKKEKKLEYVQFSRPITTPGAQDLLGKIVELNKVKGEENFTVLMSSPGGQVATGIECYQTLKALPFNITMHNTSQVDSVANIMFLAADRRLACESSTFLFHGVGIDFNTPTRLEERAAKETLESLRRDNSNLANIIAARTKLKPDMVSRLFREQHVHDSEWALENGLINGIEDPKIQSGSEIHQLL